MWILGGGRVANPYPAEFFLWWWGHIIAIDDYPYVGINFHGDPDMPLPPGSAYGDISKIPFVWFFELLFFLYLEIKNMFFAMTSTDIRFMCIDVGP